MEKMLNFKFGIQLAKKDSGQSHKHIIKGQWELFLPMIALQKIALIM
jgi:hypothetical protein